MKPTILYIIGDLDIGGAERHLTHVAPALMRDGFRVTIYTLTHKGSQAEALEAEGVEVLEPPLASMLRKLPSALRAPALVLLTTARLWLLMIARRPDVAHFFLPASYLIGGMCSLAARLPIRVMSRRSLSDYQRGHPLATRFERFLHRRMTAVLGNSRAVVEQLRDEGVPSERIGLIYNGIDLAPYRSLPPRVALRERLGLREDELVMVKVANLIPYKGHEDLLEALAAIRDRLPEDWCLLLAGRGRGFESHLKEKAVALRIGPHVRFLGERHDIPEIFGAADIGLLCSHHEGFANSILEGMAAGLPMIVTDVGGNGEVVREGETGRIVPPKNPRALGAAIAELALDPELRRRFAIKGRELVEEHFSLPHCIHSYERFYQALTQDEPSLPEDISATVQTPART